MLEFASASWFGRRRARDFYTRYERLVAINAPGRQISSRLRCREPCSLIKAWRRKYTHQETYTRTHAPLAAIGDRHARLLPLALRNTAQSRRQRLAGPSRRLFALVQDVGTGACRTPTDNQRLSERVAHRGFIGTTGDQSGATFRKALGE